VAWSPPYDYLAEVFLPAVAPLGLIAAARLTRWGFYPQGGGEITLTIQPSQTQPAQPAWTAPRGPLTGLRILSAAVRVGNQVTARQASRAYNRLTGWLASQHPHQGTASLVAPPKLVNPDSRGPGTALFLLAEYDTGQRAGFTGIGRQGYPAERVADDAVDAFIRHHQTGAAVDPHLADQLVLPLALAGRPLAFETSEITQHLLTNVWVIEQFLGQTLCVEGQLGQPGRVSTC